MSNTYSVRLEATQAEFKALKSLAVDRDTTLTKLITVAVQTSPHTKGVFK